VGHALVTCLSKYKS